MNLRPQIKIAIADDHVMMRKGTVSIINSNEDFKVIIEANDGSELIEAIETSTVIPDIAIVDINMPNMNGYETVKKLQKDWSEIRIMVLTMIDDEYAIIRMLRDGAKGYLLKASLPEDLYRGLHDIYNDKYFSSEIVSQSVLKAISYRRYGLIYPELSDMEFKVLQGYCKGMDNKTIAKDLGVSFRTIDTYRNALFEKLEVKNRVELVIFALRTGLVSV